MASPEAGQGICLTVAVCIASPTLACESGGLILGIKTKNCMILDSGANYLGLIFLLLLFYLYIYPPDLQESDGGSIHRVSNYPDLFPEMPRYCYQIVI